MTWNGIPEQVVGLCKNW